MRMRTTPPRPLTVALCLTLTAGPMALPGLGILLGTFAASTWMPVVATLAVMVAAGLTLGRFLQR